MNWAGKKLHFMGAGGVGVSALMELAYREGAVVSGCDLQSNELTDRLERIGVPIARGHSPSHVAQTDICVYSSAVPESNLERREAERQCLTLRRGTFLARLLEGKEVLGVCGTHGKSTTTWLLGQLLLATGFDPTIILGGVGQGERSNLHPGRPDRVVVELDESDGSFLEPELAVAVVTNVEADHLDHYGSLEAVEAAFLRFAGNLPPHGRLVVCLDDPGAARLARACPEQSITVGVETPTADLRAVQVGQEGAVQHFRLCYHGSDVGVFSLKLPGEHNLCNGLCALAAARAVGADWAALAEALPECRPVARRFEVVGVRRDITVVDDYAHHPTEIRVALKTARALHAGRVLAVFQPHLFSRTQFLAEDFGAALAAADLVVLADVYAARERPRSGADSQLVRDAALAHNVAVRGPFPRRQIVPELVGEVGAGDMVLFLGAGDIGACAHELLERL